MARTSSPARSSTSRFSGDSDRGPSCDDTRVEELENQVAALEAELTLTKAKLAAAEADKDPFKVTYVNLSQDDLLELAKNCDVRADLPTPLDEKSIAFLGLGDAEVQAWARAWASFEKEDQAKLVALWEEMKGERPESVDWVKSRFEFRDLAGKGDEARVRQQIAQERAGLAEVPSDLETRSLHERWRRAFADRGNDFEAALAKELGPERAHELRLADDGWPSDRRMRVMGCPREPEPGE